jgi:hypothetical protein
LGELGSPNFSFYVPDMRLSIQAVVNEMDASQVIQCIVKPPKLIAEGA